MMIQKPHERREADRDDGAPHPLLADALGEARAGVSTDHPAGRHRERDWPVDDPAGREQGDRHAVEDRKSTRLNSSHSQISYAVFCLKKKNETSQSIHTI